MIYCRLVFLIFNDGIRILLRYRFCHFLPAEENHNELDNEADTCDDGANDRDDAEYTTNDTDNHGDEQHLHTFFASKCF